jgi:hypothetical protein
MNEESTPNANRAAPPQQSPAPPIATTESRHKGVRGWLLLFCIGLTVLGPIVILGSVLAALGTPADGYRQFPRLLVVTLMGALLNLVFVAFSIYTGVCLWRIRPGAVRTAKTFLVCYLWYCMISYGLLFTAGLPSAINVTLAAQLRKQVVKDLLYFLIWYSYLNRSKRVKATYES